MIRRTLSTIILWAALGGILVLFGAHAGVWLVTALAAGSQHEFYRLREAAGRRPARTAGLAAGAVLVPAPFYAPLAGVDPLAAALGILALGLILLALVSIARPGIDRAGALAEGVLGLALVTFPLHFFVQILLLAETPPAGLILALWAVVAVKFTDIGAYLAGSFFGKHKLAPELSPGKTWEGVAGGVICSVLAAAGFAALFGEHLPGALTPLAAGALALPIAAVSIPSDLLESVLKREAGAKDSGRTIPGIGGAYDLSDSLVLSAPVAYLLLSFIVGP